MAPGPKKKNIGRRSHDTQPSGKIDAEKINKTHRDEVISNVEEPADYPNAAGNKYKKRSIVSNSSRYDEPIVDHHCDETRGADFEVLLSYSGGLGSQFCLREEKEWEDASGTDEHITLDLKDIAQALKSVPFHRRLILPEDIFDRGQLEKFKSSAEGYRSSYLTQAAAPVSVKSTEKMDADTYNSDIIESYETDDTRCQNEITHKKPVILEEKTESIIESLASCLSLKTVQEKVDSFVKVENNTGDDLDFLLSLSTNSKEVKPSVSKSTNVDDWLNSILDD